MNLYHSPGTRGLAVLISLATVCITLVAPASARGQLLPPPAALADAPAELIQRLRADPFTYFRFINRVWTARVCEAFADLSDAPTVRLHGDAHVEQFALTSDAWGLDDFDDSTSGPEFVDIVRFLGSIDLAARQRGWTRDRDALWTRFFEGYRRGLSDPEYRPPEPGLVRQLRRRVPVTRAMFLEWAGRQMRPMDAATSKAVVAGMEAFDRLVRRDRPDLPPRYFTVVRAGWLHLGVGSAAIRKVLIRVQGPTAAPEDDEVLEVKEVTNLEGVGCVEGRATPPGVRIIDGSRQLGRLKHEILAVGPTLLIAATAGRGEHWLDWLISSWEPSYRELRIVDLRSATDLADIAFDAGVQLGAGKLVSVRPQALASVVRLEGRLRHETSTIVEELLAGWRELRTR